MCESVKVALRIRPLVESEISRGCQPCVQSVADVPQVIVAGNRPFTFNFVFDSDTSQQDVYEAAVQSLVLKLFKGYNVTVLAYGQTGSGKTHTMGSNYAGFGEKGIIPRAVEDIFRHVSEHEDWEYKIAVSFMELYKEQLYDLLASERAVVEIREDTKGICIPGLTEINVTSTDGCMKCLRNGSLGRVTGATAMNKQSSRSHAIYTIAIQQQKVGDPNSATTAKFHMVDLAGSERSKKTQAEGDRFKEGVTINAGLLALGNVISALGEGSKVPSYRNSKLTRLLQDSLGGNSLTLMIACISPADYNFDETVSTLRYADRARKIKNKPVVNQDPKSAEIAMLKQKLQELQLQLIVQDGGRDIESNGVPLSNVKYEQEIEELDEKNRELEGKLRVIRRSYNDLLNDAAVMRERMLLAEGAGERMKERIDELDTEVRAALNASNNLDWNEAQRECIETFKRSFFQQWAALLDEHRRFDDEQRQHEAAHDGNISEGMEADSEEDLKAIDEQQEEHASKQSMLHKELRRLSKDLAQKKEYCEQFTKNKSLIEESLKDSKEMVVRYEKQIADLIKARDDLAKQLQAADKVPVDSFKQSELLKKNAEIDVLQKKLNEQTKLVQKKEVAEKRVQELCNEIRQIKQTKVKLIKQMKQENDRWKAWRLERERETAKLREQDRKRQNEIKRLQTLHSKQQNVSKRKLEEAVAMNRRLKDALSRQKTVRGQQKLKGNKEQIQEFVSQEIEMAVTTAAARKTLQQLMDERSAVTARIAEMRRLTLDASMNKRIAASEQELELHNAQIIQLQQKLVDSEAENRAKTRWETISSMADLKTALGYAVQLAAEGQKETERVTDSIAVEIKPQKEIIHRAVTPKVKSRKRRSAHREFEDLNLTENGNYTDNEAEDILRDPDWRNTPIHRKIKAMRTTMAPRKFDDGPFRCGCRSHCDTKRCQCFKLNASCGENCSCDAKKCKSKISASMLSNASTNGSSLNDTYVKDSEPSSPKRRKTIEFIAPKPL